MGSEVETFQNLNEGKRKLEEIRDNYILSGREFPLEEEMKAYGELKALEEDLRDYKEFLMYWNS